MDDITTKQKILETAGMLFGERGLHGTSTGDIAKTAGINKALIFYHFGSKDDLYKTVFRTWIGELKETMETRLGDVEPGLEMLQTFVRAHIEFLLGHQNLLQVMVRELLADMHEPSLLIAELADALKPFRNHLLVGISAGKKKNEIRDIDPMQTLVNIISLNMFFFLGRPILTMINPSVNFNEFSRDRVNHVVDLIVNGIKQRGE